MNKGAKISLIVAGALIFCGMILFTAVLIASNWSFKRITNSNYETNTYEIAEDFSSISIHTNTADLSFVPSEDETCKVECYEEQKEKHIVSAEDGILTIQVAVNKKWHDYIGINMGTPKVTVFLPKAKYDQLIIREDTGDISIHKNFFFDTLDIDASTADVLCVGSDAKNVKIKLSTGDLILGAMNAQTVELTTTTGDIEATSLVCGDLSVSVSTGKTRLEDVSCGTFTSTGSTGDLLMKNVIAEGKIDAERSTGEIRLDHCDAAELCFLTDTGEVEGSLLSEKIFFIETSTGDVDVPKTTSGGTCEIITSTGDIEIEIVK